MTMETAIILRHVTWMSERTPRLCFSLSLHYVVYKQQGIFKWQYLGKRNDRERSCILNNSINSSLELNNGLDDLQ